MYLRKTRRKNKDGSTVEYLQLAHNERNPQTGKPVANIIHNFGRADQVDRDQLVRLCRSIARVCDAVVIDPFDNEQGSLLAAAVGLPADLKLKRTVSLGAPLVAEKLWQTVGLKDTIANIANRNKLRAPYERALFAMVTNRLRRPESKLGVWDRWLPTFYLPDCQDLELSQMYEAMDFLHEHHEEIEKTIFFHTANLFNLSVDLVFYDTTTAAFSIDREDDDDNGDPPLRRFGHSKEGSWSPQVVVVLAVTAEGIPVRSWVFSGNTSDVTTVQIKMTPMYHWVSRRIEAHVRICVLALLIERLAELSCGRPWHQIIRSLETLQATEFSNLNHRFFCRNEVSKKVREILKYIEN